MTTPLTYTWLYDTVRKRFDSEAALEAFLPQPATPDALRARGNDRYLSAMTQRIFQAGMQHTVVDARWPAFETALDGFDPERMATLNEDDIERCMHNPQLIRHRTKLRSIAHNARFILDVCAEQRKSFGAFIADWPIDDIVGLWHVLGKRGSRLGGRSAAGFLRLAGKDTFLTTSHVVARLAEAGLIEREPTSQRDLRKMQAVFNTLHQQSGRPLCQLSALLALSIHPTDLPGR